MVGKIHSVTAAYGSARKHSIDLNDPDCGDFERMGREVGRLAAERDHVIGWGRGTLGAMYTIPEYCLKAGGNAYGVFLERLHQFEYPGPLPKPLLGDIRVRTWGARTFYLGDVADNAIATIGGFGTLHEIASDVQNGLDGVNPRPIPVVSFAPNGVNPYKYLYQYYASGAAQGFVPSRACKWLHTASDPEQVWPDIEGIMEGVAGDQGIQSDRLSRSNYLNGGMPKSYPYGLRAMHDAADVAGHILGRPVPSVAIVAPRKAYALERALRNEPGSAGVLDMYEGVQNITERLYGNVRIITRAIESGIEGGVFEKAADLLDDDPEHKYNPREMAKKVVSILPRSIRENRTGDRSVISERDVPLIETPTHYHADDLMSVQSDVSLIIPGGPDTAQSFFLGMNAGNVAMSLNVVSQQQHGDDVMVEIPRRTVLFNPGGITNREFNTMIHANGPEIEAFTDRPDKTLADLLLLQTAVLMRKYRTIGTKTADLLFVANTEEQAVQATMAMVNRTQEERMRVNASAFRIPQRQAIPAEATWGGVPAVRNLEKNILALRERGQLVRG